MDHPNRAKKRQGEEVDVMLHPVPGFAEGQVAHAAPPNNFVSGFIGCGQPVVVVHMS
jgi:hypothetical protein